MILAVNAFTSAYAQSDFFGKLIFLGLLALSVVSWVVLSHKTWQMRKVKQISEAFRRALEKHKEELLSLDLENLPKPRLKEIPHPFAEIFLALKQKSVDILNKNHFFARELAEKENKISPVYLSPSDLELIEAYALSALSTQIKKLEKNLFILSTVTTLGPFLGLLGTVWGILVTFSGLHGGGSIGSNSAILGGLSTALATTVLGLLIAIPALISYNYLKNGSKYLSSDMEDFLCHLLSQLELQYRKVELERHL